MSLVSFHGPCRAKYGYVDFSSLDYSRGENTGDSVVVYRSEHGTVNYGIISVSLFNENNSNLFKYTWSLLLPIFFLTL